MHQEKYWKPLTIAGAVLLINGVIFLLVVFTIQPSAYWGAAIGCFGTGIPLLIVGLLQHKALKEKSRAD